jgi:predicted DNA-binding protein
MRFLMGRTVIILPDDLESRFKSEVFRRFGMKKGNITRAIQEAIELWMETVSLAKYIDEMIKRAIEEIESDPKLTTEQKNIAKEFFIKRVNEMLPIYLSTVARNILKELKTPSSH